MPRHFWRTVVVFRRYRPPSSVKKKGSSSRGLGSPPEFVVPASARSPGRLPWGLLPLRDVSPASPRFDGHPRPTCVPPPAFHTLSTGCSSHCLAGLFHPAATSRLLASGASSPDLSGSTSSVARASSPLAPSPAAGCPATPECVASTSRPSPRPGSAASTEVLAPAPPVSPRALLLLRARFVSLGVAVNAPSARGLGPPVLAVPRSTNPQRLDRLTISMLYP
jgi:hypothetical protein